MLKYWNKLITFDDNRLIKKIFKWDFSLASNVDSVNWSSEVTTILSSIDEGSIFLIKPTYDLNRCEQSLKENDINQWFVNVNSKPMLQTCVKFKTEFKPELFNAEYPL